MCHFECLSANVNIAVMSGKELPKVADAEKESQYGYVFGVSGPGEDIFNICTDNCRAAGGCHSHRLYSHSCNCTQSTVKVES